MEGMDTPSPFWLRLQQAIAAKGLPTSQAAVARLAGLSRSAMTPWVSGTGLPSFKRASKLAEILGCNVVWLLTGQGEMGVARESDKKLIEFLEVWSELPEKQKAHILQTARILKQMDEQPTDNQQPTESNQ